MGNFDVELHELVEKWRKLGSDDDSICLALMNEIEACDDRLDGDDGE